MCNFKSAIVVKDESAKGGFRLLMSPWTESHSELCTIFKLNDTASAKLYFARVEFSPPSLETAHQVETYVFRLDEGRTPDWWTDEIAEAVTERMRAYITSIIVTGDVALLVGGQFIVAPGARIESAHSMVISAMCGGTLTAMWGGTLTEMRGGTLTEMWGGTLTVMRGGTLTAMRGGTLTEMWGGTLTEMWGGTLTAMRGGTLTEISKYFTGLLGTVAKAAKVLKDGRT